MKNKKFIIEDLKKSDLDKFYKFTKKFYNNKILIKKKFYASIIFNKKMLDYLFFNTEHNSYNFKILKYNNVIVAIHGFIPMSHFDKKLNSNEIFLGLLIGSNKINIPLMPLTYSSISKNDTSEFIGSINPTLLPFLKLKKFKLEKMNHHFIVSTKKKKFFLCKIEKNIKIKKFESNNYKYEFLDAHKLKKLKTKKLYDHQIPKKSDEYLINRYINHPIYKYKLIASYSKKNELKIIFVCREINIKKSSALRIVDVVGSNKHIYLFESAISEMIKKYEYIDLYSYGIPKKILESAGFLNIDNFKKTIIPNYYEPFLKKNIELICGFKSSVKKNVRLFKGDVDQDHPRIK